MKPPIFNSADAFRNAFESGLERLLDEFNELGVFILVLANAAFDAQLWDALNSRLGAKFEHLAKAIRERDALGLALDDAEDDIQVFRQLLVMGFDALSVTRFRYPSPWELQFNPLRALRPPRLGAERVQGISAPFDPAGFNFNKPFLRKESLWRGALDGRRVALLYNKYPFVSMHGLLVPEPEAGAPQLLRETDNDYLWRITERLDQTLPGVGFGYNSYGAGASVNHLHFQMFQRSRPLTVTAPGWRHNGGPQPYPTDCHGFDNPAEAWQLISELHRTQISYNLIYLPGHLYCLPRRSQGTLPHSSQAGSFAWYELAGGFTCFIQEDFDRLMETDLAAELSLLAN